jgi:MFS family permease
MTLPNEPIGPRAALRVTAYRRWFLAQIFSASGTSTQLVGMSWLVVQRTDSGIALGALTAAIFLPVLLVGPWAGQVIDRVNRRVLLMGTQIAFFVIGAVLVAVTWVGADSLPVLYAVALTTGIVNAFDGPARQVYLMDVLPRPMLQAAIGLYEVVQNGARVLGPAVAGALLATGSVLPCFVFNALAFLPALCALVRNRHASSHAAVVTADSRSHGMWSGLRWSFTHRSILVTMVLASVSGMLFNLAVTIPVIATHVFDLGGGGYGLLLAVFGGGALLGAFRAATQHETPRFVRITILALITGALTVITALAPTSWLLATGLFIVGATSIWFITRANTLVQLEAPPALRGQVMSVWNMAIPGMNPITGLAAGVAIDLVGPRAGLALPGILFLVVASAALIVARARGSGSAR